MDVILRIDNNDDLKKLKDMNEILIHCQRNDIGVISLTIALSSKHKYFYFIKHLSSTKPDTSFELFTNPKLDTLTCGDITIQYTTQMQINPSLSPITIVDSVKKRLEHTFNSVNECFIYTEYVTTINI